MDERGSPRRLDDASCVFLSMATMILSPFKCDTGEASHDQSAFRMFRAAPSWRIGMLVGG